MFIKSSIGLCPSPNFVYECAQHLCPPELSTGQQLSLSLSRTKTTLLPQQRTIFSLYIGVRNKKAPKRQPPEAAFQRPSIHHKSLSRGVLKHRAKSHAGRVREIHLDTRSGRDVIIMWPYHFFSSCCWSSHFI